MNKSGMTSQQLFWAFVSVAVLVVVLLFLFTQGGKLAFFFELIPGFNQTVAEGDSILGYNLLNSQLYYYTGSKWKEIETNQEKFVLGDYGFDPGKVAIAFEDFYYSSGRRPIEPIWQTPNFRLWRVSDSSLFSREDSRFQPWLILDENPLPNYEGEKIYVDEFGYSYSLDSFLINYQDSIEEESPIQGFAPPRTGKYFQNVYQPIVEQGVAWRDQILKGKECEKFFRIEDISGDYVVDRTDEYLHIELTVPIYSGAGEKWQDEECFTIPEIEDVSNWINYAKVEIKFHPDRDSEVDTISWESNKGWSYVPENRDAIKMDSDDLPDSEYRLTREQQQDFYDGLMQFSGARLDPGAIWDDYFGMIDGADDTDIEVYIGEGSFLEKKDLNYGGLILIKDGSLDNDPLRALRFADFVTTEYNKYLRLPKEELLEEIPVIN